MYIPTAKGYFSGCGGAELGMMQAGVNVIHKKTVPIQELMSTAGGRSLIKAQIETLKLKYPGMRLLNDNINLECLQEK